MMKCMNIGRRPYTFENVQGLRPIHLTGCPLAPPNYAALRKGGASTGEASSMLFYLTGCPLTPPNSTSLRKGGVSTREASTMLFLIVSDVAVLFEEPACFCRMSGRHMERNLRPCCSCHVYGSHPVGPHDGRDAMVLKHASGYRRLHCIGECGNQLPSGGIDGHVSRRFL